MKIQCGYTDIKVTMAFCCQKSLYWFPRYCWYYENRTNTCRKKMSKVMFATSIIRGKISITDMESVSLRFWQRENYDSFLEDRNIWNEFAKVWRCLCLQRLPQDYSFCKLCIDFLGLWCSLAISGPLVSHLAFKLSSPLKNTD